MIIKSRKQRNSCLQQNKHITTNACNHWRLTRQLPHLITVTFIVSLTLPFHNFLDFSFYIWVLICISFQFCYFISVFLHHLNINISVAGKALSAQSKIIFNFSYIHGVSMDPYTCSVFISIQNRWHSLDLLKWDNVEKLCIFLLLFIYLFVDSFLNHLSLEKWFIFIGLPR